MVFTSLWSRTEHQWVCFFDYLSSISGSSLYLVEVASFSGLSLEAAVRIPETGEYVV